MNIDSLKPVVIHLLMGVGAAVLTGCGGGGGGGSTDMDPMATTPATPTTTPPTTGSSTDTGSGAGTATSTSTGTGTSSGSGTAIGSGIDTGTSTGAGTAMGSGSSSGGTSSSTGTAVGTGTGTSTAGVLCSLAYSALNTTPSVNAVSSATWGCTSTNRTLIANGLPDHPVGTFPNAHNPNAITAQKVSASLHLTPALSAAATSLGPGTVAAGYVLNGVKIDAATAGACTDASACSLTGNTGNWSIEALGQTSFNFGADSNNAHVQPGGTYHYHGMPEGFISQLNKGMAMTLIGWAADGFPIYARYGYTLAADAHSAIKTITSSYRLKATTPSNRPSTTTYPLGTFKQDYEYVAGLGDLDECNGRTGVTPEFPSGIYHYFATDSYPYLQRCVKGTL